MSNPRVTAAMKKAALQALADGIAVGRIDPDELCLAIITADDHTTRYVVVTQDVMGRVIVYGPYATHDAANKAIDSGVCATREGTKAMIQPLVPSPKVPRTRKKKEAQ